MHSKIIRPAIHGKKAYDNKGSSVALIQYLGHEAREEDRAPNFFNQTAENIAPEEVRKRIDENVKGLRKTEIKFYSLILSPSADELQHLRGKPESLKDFAREAMRNYAEGFNLAQGKKLGAQDLVWFATLHQHRHYRGNELEVKRGEAKSGERKPGLQTHIHIVISKRDITQKISLNPQGSKERFSMRAWQQANEQAFDRLFSYERKMKTVKPNQVRNLDKIEQRIQNKLFSINGMLSKNEQLTKDQLWAIGQSRNFDSTFFLNLNRLETNLKQGRVVRDPLHLLTHNRDCRPAIPDMASIGRNIQTVLQELKTPMAKIGSTEELSVPTLEGKRIRSLHRRRRRQLSL